MASRIIHLAVAKEIIKQYHAKDIERFYFGSVLPDAATTKAAHYDKYVDHGTKKTFDLTGFRHEYMDKIVCDDLYLAYYLHLLEDIVFRYFMYTDTKYDPRFEGNVDKLHRDYEITNRYVIHRYKLDSPISVPKDILEEPLLARFDFRVYEFAEEIRKDFIEIPSGNTCFFTEAMADMYIEMAVKKCLNEIESFFYSHNHFDENTYAWQRH